MKITIYQNKRNKNKYIEVHNDGHYHNTVRQFMKWHNGVVNYVGARIGKKTTLARWKINNLKELLEDYQEV